MSRSMRYSSLCGLKKDILMAGSTQVTNDDLEQLRPRLGKNGVFICPWKAFERPGFLALLQWKCLEKNEKNIPSNNELDMVLPMRPVDFVKLNDPIEDKVQVTWIGHATVLVQFDGITILSDPVFSDKKRYRQAVCKIEEIPKLDAVIISHNHYDHLDNESVLDINKKFPKVKWFVASNTKLWFIRQHVPEENITELSWWDEKAITVNEKTFRFICTPAQHWCQRGPFDLNKCLWCSWAIKGPRHSYYFAGDTGYYGPLFKTIGEKYGPFSIAAIPIGAYSPRWMMEYQHIDPEEAVKIHTDMKSEQSIGIHWGTFKQANEFYIEPPMKLSKEMKKAGLDTSKFISLCHGETWVVGEKRDMPPFMDEQYHPRDHVQEQPADT